MAKFPSDTKDIGVNSREFVFKHLSQFKAIFLPLVPYLVICDLLYPYLEPHGDLVSLPVLILEVYVFSVLAISWHKLVILGEDSDYKTSFWSVINHEFLFFRTWLFLSLILPMLLVFLLITVPDTFSPSLSSFLDSGFGLLIASVFFVLYCYVMLSIVLFFPAAAVGAPITLRKAFREGRKLIGQIFISTIYATWKIFLAWFLYGIAAGGAVTGIMILGLHAKNMEMDSMMAGLLYDDDGVPVEKTEPFLSPLYNLLASIPDEYMFSWYKVGMHLVGVPVYYIFMPLLTVLCVSVVSNFYLRKRSNL